jgi:hypothetical protein
MGKKSCRKNVKPPGRCMFCEGGNLSKEHFWPEWASALLPTYPDNRHVEQVYTVIEKTKLVKPSEVRTRQGHSWTKTIRAVCGPCNSGWMSVLETAARPILTPLIATQPHSITVDSMRVLAQWIALKIMVGERNHPEDAVTPLEDRTRFRATLDIPPNFKIWIAQCGTQGWDTGYLRHAATVGTSPIVMPHHRFKNIHSVAFGIGDLFVFVIHTTVANVANVLTFQPSEAVIPLFPIVNSASWPPPRRLSGDAANAVADTLNRLFSSPTVRWAPGFP